MGSSKAVVDVLSVCRPVRKLSTDFGQLTTWEGSASGISHRNGNGFSGLWNGNGVDVVIDFGDGFFTLG